MKKEITLFKHFTITVTTGSSVISAISYIILELLLKAGEKGMIEIIRTNIPALLYIAVLGALLGFIIARFEKFRVQYKIDKLAQKISDTYLYLSISLTNKIINSIGEDVNYLYVDQLREVQKKYLKIEPKLSKEKFDEDAVRNFCGETKPDINYLKENFLDKELKELMFTESEINQIRNK